MSRDGTNWVCEFCNHAQVITTSRYHRPFQELQVRGWKHGKPGVRLEAIVCSNDQCRELTLSAFFTAYEEKDHALTFTDNRKLFRLFPPSQAKPVPEYVPAPIRSDYEEACAIRDLSPKASATIIRRCIQGMIRDFCGIRKKTLFEEISALRKAVDAGQGPRGVEADTVDAIDHVRGIGNIGAHMEVDINVIIDVDPNEAQQLIGLVELLFAEWYVARERRKAHLIKIGAIADDKKAAKQKPAATSDDEPPAAQ